jgi:hypothetical protein
MSVLSPQWYPQFPHPDSDSFDFKVLCAWLAKQVGTPKPEIVAEKMYGTEALAPHQLVFTKSAQTKSIDAVLASVIPEQALIDLQRAFGLPITGEHYTKPSLTLAEPAKPKQPDNPIGGPIPNAPGWFHCLPNDQHRDGEEITGPDGNEYYRQTTITAGPCWYCPGLAA